ncbi:MAG TPA: hypothetical protein DCZ75_01395 [Geobacter sp.]|nr:hypothetical protein [Geobacter sp.]
MKRLKGVRVKWLMFQMVGILFLFASVSFCPAQDLQTRFGKVSIVAFDKQGNVIDGNGMMEEYKKIQYLFNDKVIHEEIVDYFGQPSPELDKIFKQSKSDAVLIIHNSGGSLGQYAIQFITVSSTGAKFSKRSGGRC